MYVHGNKNLTGLTKYLVKCMNETAFHLECELILVKQKSCELEQNSNNIKRNSGDSFFSTHFTRYSINPIQCFFFFFSVYTFYTLKV